MPRCLVLTLVAGLLLPGIVSSGTTTALGQAASPSLPGAPQPTLNYPGGSRLPQGAVGGSGSYAISAAANDHGAFLWVVDNVQHAVVLCEKTDGGRDFTCAKKPLP